MRGGPAGLEEAVGPAERADDVLQVEIELLDARHVYRTPHAPRQAHHRPHKWRWARGCVGLGAAYA